MNSIRIKFTLPEIRHLRGLVLDAQHSGEYTAPEKQCRSRAERIGIKLMIAECIVKNKSK